MADYDVDSAMKKAFPNKRILRRNRRDNLFHVDGQVVYALTSKEYKQGERQYYWSSYSEDLLLESSMICFFATDSECCLMLPKTLISRMHLNRAKMNGRYHFEIDTDWTSISFWLNGRNGARVDITKRRKFLLSPEDIKASAVALHQILALE